jgi:hypothetical protein
VLTYTHSLQPTILNDVNQIQNRESDKGYFTLKVKIMTLMSHFFLPAIVLLRAKKVGHQISVSFEKFDVVQALLSFFLTLFQLTV